MSASNQALDDYDLPKIDDLQTFSRHLDSNEIDKLEIIHKILKNPSRNGEVTYSSGKTILPALPGLVINGYGDVSLPLGNQEVLKLMSFMRKSDQISTYEIESSKIIIKNPLWDFSILSLANELAQAYSICGKLHLKQSKLILFTPGAKVDEIQFTDNSVFGQLIIQFPSSFNGGEIIIEHGNSRFDYNFALNSEFNTQYVAYHKDIDYSMKEIKSGNRLCLFYDVCWSNENGFNFCYGIDSDRKMEEALNTLSMSGMRLAIELSPFDIKKFRIDKFSSVNIKDFERIRLLKEANDRLSFENRFNFCLALVESEFTPNTDTSKIDYSSFSFSKHKINRIIDSDGIDFLLNQNLTLNFFTKILHPDEDNDNSEDYDQQSYWYKNSNQLMRGSNCYYYKYYLALWPQKANKEILIKMDPKAFIKSTYKEIFCDVDGNFDSVLDNLDIIIEELQTISSPYLEEQTYFYLFESLKLIQDEKLAIDLLKTNSFKLAYALLEPSFIEKLALFLNEFDFDCIRDVIASFMLPIDVIRANNGIKLIRHLLQLCNHKICFSCMDVFGYQLAKSKEVLEDFIQKDFLDALKNLTKFDYCNRELFDLLPRLLSYPVTDFIDQNCSLIEDIYVFDKVISHDCLKIAVIPTILDKDDKISIPKHINYLILSRILKTIALFEEESERLDSLIKTIIIEVPQKEIKNMIDDLFKENDKIRKHKSIIKLFEYRLRYVKSEIESNWKMPNAKYPKNKPEIDKFLKSNRQIMHYKWFDSIRDARKWVAKHIYYCQDNNYSIQMNAVGRGVCSRIEIKKVRDYFEKSCPLTKQYKEEINKIQLLFEQTS